ncbi:ComEC/Rec2 family competence protein [Lentzea sp. HUAS12]|uniref:ComEC/Rec2 family competence protein n=1 Tax=Lentzea sp. HUAS12 TaxID=2951806 RepID=UPI00209D6F92|nr:MBL fold metallo-hydrolase [Lentzea sp. HUAS12]USX49916.1 MBL fold metallo-hydrolase [Lentzea sp. HUAS12]
MATEAREMASPQSTPDVDTSNIAEIVILDVGHGNCALLRDNDRAIVIDAAPGVTLFDELERSGIRRIEHLVLSHADLDHMGGAIKLLWDLSIPIGTVWYNPDGTKSSKAWQRFARQMSIRAKAGDLKANLAINNMVGDSLSMGRVGIEVLHPSIEFATLGQTSYSRIGGAITSNTLSVVVRVSLGGRPAVLLTADIDNQAFEHILTQSLDLRSEVLVFPHHGGRSGAPGKQFAAAVCQAVEPKVVIFSLGRGKHSTPDPDIVSGVRESASGPHIACTQLSESCRSGSSTSGDTHLSLRSAAGRAAGKCCAGTITVTLSDDGIVIDPPIARHEEFVQLAVPTPLCKPRCRASGDG